MEIPTTRDELLEVLVDFGRETYPTLMAIIAIAVYSGFVFMFYRILAKKDLLTLDLSKYADDFGGKVKKYLRSVLFVIQYIVVVPILIAFWTLVLAVILLFCRTVRTTLATLSSPPLWSVPCASSRTGPRTSRGTSPRCSRSRSSVSS